MELYLEILLGWLQATGPLKQQQGMTVLQYATGDLRLAINELDVTTLTSIDGGEMVYKHVQTWYREYIEKRWPRL